ncbi:MAG: hypothetical protein GY913_13370 [Proteobacteria bacterium]|nr:hypothetical protein [Pseudomonadota bacterium]MCP4917897.1 hypothetical protein [Pseudomonadota bacterium]
MPRVELIGASGRLRWNGHLRLSVGSGDIRGTVAVRLGAGKPPVEAWEALSSLASQLGGCTGDTPQALVESVVSVLDALGADDLAAVVAATDAEGSMWLGRGLDAVRIEGQPSEVPETPTPLEGDLVGLGHGDTAPAEWT